jgi:glyoxylase-like metal-dependent hydrolase (beta-lactamase superfamily II)
MELKLGKRRVILATLPGHTGGDVFAFVPDANVVFTGDLGWSKTLPNLVDATVNDWIPTLDRIVKDHPNAKYVPGHGNVATAADLTVDQAKQQLTLPEKYKSFAFQNFATPNVEDMYKELKGIK